MEIFSAKRTYKAGESFVSHAMESLRDTFEDEGYVFDIKSESLNRTVVDMQRGNVLHQIAGLRNGLEITFVKFADRVEVRMNCCLLENHVAGPAAIAIAIPKLRIPIAATDTVGVFFDARLLSKVSEALDCAYEEFSGETLVFCTHCGARIQRADGVCDECGYQVSVDMAAEGC